MTRKDIEELLVGRLRGFETKREEQWFKLGLKEGLDWMAGVLLKKK